MKRAAVILGCLVFLAAGAATVLPAQGYSPVGMAAAVTPALAATADMGGIGTGLFYALPGASALASFEQHASQVGVLAPQSFSLDYWGELRGSVPADMADIARQQGVAMMPLVINRGFSSWQALRLLGNRYARDRAVDALVQTGLVQGLAGWQIDFEDLPWTARAAFSRFVAEAADALHRHGMQLSVAVAARTNDDVHNASYRDFSGVYDYAALARSADFLSVMAYPESDASHPGPLASTPWVEQVIRYVLTQVPADKISLGLPDYQSTWMERRVRVTVRRRIDGRIHWFYHHVYRIFHRNGPFAVRPSTLHWDPVLQTSYRIQGRGPNLHIVWVEDDRSFAAKLRLVALFHLRGYSVWRIGLEDPRIWNELPPVERIAQAGARETADPDSPLPQPSVQP